MLLFDNECKVYLMYSVNPVHIEVTADKLILEQSFLIDIQLNFDQVKLGIFLTLLFPLFFVFAMICWFYQVFRAKKNK